MSYPVSSDAALGRLAERLDRVIEKLDRMASALEELSGVVKRATADDAARAPLPPMMPAGACIGCGRPITWGAQHMCGTGPREG